MKKKIIALLTAIMVAVTMFPAAARAQHCLPGRLCSLCGYGGDN